VYDEVEVEVQGDVEGEVEVKNIYDNYVFLLRLIYLH
jgi:hypothetical protein